MTAQGLIGPNGGALASAEVPEHPGTGSALLGFVTWVAAGCHRADRGSRRAGHRRTDGTAHDRLHGAVRGRSGAGPAGGSGVRRIDLTGSPALPRRHGVPPVGGNWATRSRSAALSKIVARNR